MAETAENNILPESINNTPRQLTIANRKQKDIETLLSKYLPHLTPKQKKALKILSEIETLPETITDLAALFKIHRRQWYGWMVNSYWRDAFHTITRARFGYYVPAVMAQVQQRSGKSDTAARLLLEYTGLLAPPQAQVIVQVNNATAQLLADHGDKLKQLAESLDGVIDAEIE